jgi:hypothetical protein
LFSPFTAWFPGGAMLLQRCIRWPQSLKNLPRRFIALYHNYYGKNINDYDLKSKIFIDTDVLWITVNYNEFACGQKDVRCVSMA